MKLTATHNEIFKHINVLLNSETFDHLERVSKLTFMLLTIHNERLGLGLSHSYINNIVKASVLHDLGKAMIPSEILNKPGKLTDIERAIIEKHPLYGAEVLAQLEEELQVFDNNEERVIAEQVILCHHEKWNGKGYPSNLKGDKIPFPARVVAIADVFDALTSARPYKRAWTVEEALNLVQFEKGAQFDPALVESFLLLENVLLEEEKQQQAVS